MKNKLSVVILTRNNEHQIVKAILSVKKIASEIIVIDDESVDKTVYLAKKQKAKIFIKKLINFSNQRNFGLKKAQGDWILFLDSDEIVSSKLANEILKKVENQVVNGYLIKRIDIFLGKKIKNGEAGNTFLLRLGRKDSGAWERGVHEYWNIKGLTQTLTNPLYHYSHRNIEEFIKNINQFSTFHALENRKEGKTSNIIKIFIWPVGKFVYYYCLKLGFLDGFQGFIYALMMSLHSFLSWTKLWLIQKQK